MHDGGVGVFFALIGIAQIRMGVDLHQTDRAVQGLLDPHDCAKGQAVLDRMTDVLRPSLYGAIHPTTVLPGSGKTADVGDETESVVIVGHCCESGDLMTPLPGEPEALGETTLRKADIGDILVMDGSGAYCSGMSSKNYNSFPEAPEVLVDKQGKSHLIRKRQEVTTMWQNELPLPTALLGEKATAEANLEYNP